MIDAAFTFAKKYMRQKVNKDTAVGQAAGEEDVKRQSSWNTGSWDQITAQ